VTRDNGTGDTSATGPERLPEQAFEMPFMGGEIIGGKYQVLELLGVGGVGFVVAANHVELGQRVALKFLRPEMLRNPEVVGRFSQEAMAAVKIKSDHVARVFDVGTMPDGAPFIVIEHLEGKNLEEILSEQGPLPIKRAIDYVMQACEALADAHACGVVHRDVKPENLFLTQRSQGIEVIKMLDFGVSKVALTGSAFDIKMPLVRTMLPVGSPVYMSPEQIRASQNVDVRTDIWSIGCVLYELLTGRPAFDAPSVTELAATILEQDPVPVRATRPEVPPALEAIIARCLEKNPHKRYQNMAELALALYPFGPRRARLYAERCCVVLNVAETSYSEFELPSMHGSIRAPALPPDSSDAPSITTTESSPTTPANKTRWAILVGSAVVLLTVLLALWAGSRPSRPAAIATERIPGPPPVAAPSSPSPPPALPPATVVAAPEDAPSAAPVPTPVRAAPAPAPPRQNPREAAPKKSAPAAPSEPDPGF
jgi:eukaryotic-like serine/threonine-protein kinase